MVVFVRQYNITVEVLKLSRCYDFNISSFITAKYVVKPVLVVTLIQVPPSLNSHKFLLQNDPECKKNQLYQATTPFSGHF